MENKATIDEIRKILSYISKGYKVPRIVYDVVFKIAKFEIEEKKKVVLIKRDPDIHKNRIQAVYVKIIEGNAMDIHPATVSGYGADFDGDCLYSYVVLYTLKNEKYESIRLHISEFDKHFKCKFLNEKCREDGVIIKNYTVLDDVYCRSINKNGDIEFKKITNWSVHENLKMYLMNLGM